MAKIDSDTRHAPRGDRLEDTCRIPTNAGSTRYADDFDRYLDRLLDQTLEQALPAGESPALSTRQERERNE